MEFRVLPFKSGDARARSRWPVFTRSSKLIVWAPQSRLVIGATREASTSAGAESLSFLGRCS
jgi:hypothetical protein